MWASASDWALRRLLKVLLKRNLKGVLETELDVEQLHVSLGTGALELTDVLISRDWLAERAVSGLVEASRGGRQSGVVVKQGATPCAGPVAERGVRQPACASGVMVALTLPARTLGFCSLRGWIL